MYWNNELTITMNTNTAATAAMMAAKEILANTAIEEYYKGEFAEFANCLMVAENKVSCTDKAAVRWESYELVLPEILKAIAAQGNEFCGRSFWDSTYDYARWEFSFDGKELSITSTYHSVEDEPMCQKCEEDLYYYNEAAKYGTPENVLLKNIRNDFPGMVEVVVSGREQTTPRPNHRLTYENMEKYIHACGGNQKLLAEFATVKAQSKTAVSPYKYVCDWFTEQFPNYKTAKKAEERLQKAA